MPFLVQDIEYRFSACELAALAVEVEAKGRAFYDQLAGELQAAPLREACRFLADQEEDHRKQFRTIASYYWRQSIEHAYSADIAALLRRPLRKIVRLFSERNARPLDRGGVLGCLNLAREVEATSVTVYGHMRQRYSPQFADVLDRIVAEEKNHLIMVNDMLSEVAKTDQATRGGDPGVGSLLRLP